MLASTVSVTALGTIHTGVIDPDVSVADRARGDFSNGILAQSIGGGGGTGGFAAAIGAGNNAAAAVSIGGSGGSGGAAGAVDVTSYHNVYTKGFQAFGVAAQSLGGGGGNGGLSLAFGGTAGGSLGLGASVGIGGTGGGGGNGGEVKLTSVGLLTTEGVGAHAILAQSIGGGGGNGGWAATLAGAKTTASIAVGVGGNGQPHNNQQPFPRRNYWAQSAPGGAVPLVTPAEGAPVGARVTFTVSLVRFRSIPTTGERVSIAVGEGALSPLFVGSGRAVIAGTLAVLALRLDHGGRRAAEGARRAAEGARRAAEGARRTGTIGGTAGSSGRARTRSGSGRPGSALLRLLDEDRAPGEHLVVPLVDGRVSIGICRDLDKGKPARTLRLTVDGNAHALNGPSRLRERFSQLLLRDGVGQVANKQLSTHLLLLFSLICSALVSTTLLIVTSGTSRQLEMPALAMLALSMLLCLCCCGFTFLWI